jgi:glycerophosphoryl diester phosphodiesterase
VLPAAASVARVGEPFVRSAHAAGLRVGTWIVDEPEPAGELARWGVDAIATNDPSIVVPAVRAVSA